MPGATDRAMQLNRDGLAWAERREFSRAWECYSQAIGLLPDHAAFYHNRGLAAFEGGHYDHALQDFQRSLKLEPGNAETLCARAMTFARLEQPERALADFDASLRADPQAPRTWSNRGFLFSQAERWEEALSNWRQALQLEPQSPFYNFLVGEALCELRRHLDAIGFLDRAIALGYRDVHAYKWRGLCRHLHGDVDGALADLNIALQLFPDHKHSLLYRAEIAHLAGQKYQAFADYSRLIALGDDGPRIRRQRAELFYDAGKLKEAWSDLEAAIKLAPEDLASYRWRAKTLLAGGHVELAERELQRMDALAQQRCQSLRPTASEVPVALVQANRLLYEPGESDEYCGVLLTFDPAWTQQPARLQFLASIVASLKGTHPADPKLQEVAAMVTNEAALLYRRQALPTSLTEGARIYFADLLIYRRFLPQRRLDSGQLLPVIAEPGDVGRMELLPVS